MLELYELIQDLREFYIFEYTFRHILIGFDVTRYSLDKEVNAYGRRLTDLCKSTNKHVANGRIGLDRGIGKLRMQALLILLLCHHRYSPM